MELDFRTLDVFTEETFGGNPLGVFPDAAHLPSELMQKIAREMNLAETVFLGPPETPEGTARVRIFTPEVEVPFRGASNRGSPRSIWRGRSPFDAGPAFAGPRTDTPIWCSRKTSGWCPHRWSTRRGRPVFAQFTTAVLPERRESPHSLEQLAAMVGLEADDLGGKAPTPLAPAMMSCGLPFHVIPVRTLAALGRAVLDTVRWREMLADTWAHHVYLVCPLFGGDVRVRMFAPGSGVPEDPATGSAAAVLGGYLGEASRRPNGTLTWQVAQGEEMERPSLIKVEVDKVAGRITAVRVGGAATFVSRGTMAIPGSPIAPPEGLRASWLKRYARRL